MTTSHPQARAILDRFAELSAIPRPSKHEDLVLSWLMGWAEEHGFAHRSDAARNLIIGVPGTAGRQAAPLLALQAHVDMVCEKLPESTHDFERDPILITRDGDWLRAVGTTLGADNGAAVALIMTLAECKEIEHPPLELLFTVDEETGLNGAMALGADFLRAQRLINLDSEEVGIFTIGCAGGRTTTGTVPIKRFAVEGLTSLRLTVSGLTGGHSGVDIHLNRANAIRLLAETLRAIMGRHDLHLQMIEGGKATNALPRHAEAVIAVAPVFVAEVAKIVQDRLFDLKKRWSETDPDLSVTLEPAQGSFAEPMTPECGGALLHLLMTLPHGVIRMAPQQQGLVETSCNLARVTSGEASIEIALSERSIVMQELDTLAQRVGSILGDHLAEVHHADGYPAWQPNFESPLLARSLEVFQELYHSEPRVEVIHAGLECGVIGSKYPGIDMISYGPTIRDPHSPSERLYIPSLGSVWDLTVALLRGL